MRGAPACPSCGASWPQQAYLPVRPRAVATILWSGRCLCTTGEGRDPLVCCISARFPSSLTALAEALDVVGAEAADAAFGLAFQAEAAP